MLFLICCICSVSAIGHTAIFLVPGITSDGSQLQYFRDFVQNNVKSDIDVIAYEYENQASLSFSTPMLDQLEQFSGYLSNYNYSTISLICFSQGGLLCRSYIELYDNKVTNLITLVTPHSGVIGLSNIPTKFINMYTKNAQAKYSFASYWYDPSKINSFCEYCIFLQQTNQINCSDVSSITINNLSKLNNFVIISSVNDDVIVPSYSTSFDSYEIIDNEITMIQFDKTNYYLSNAFGIKDLAFANKLHFFTNTCSHDKQKDPSCFDQLYFIFDFLN